MAQQLKIVLGGKSTPLDADTAIATLENALELLRAVEKHFSMADDQIHWEIVRASMRSPLTLTLEPRATGVGATRLGERIAKACVVGLRHLGQEVTAPEFFNDGALDAARKLATTLRDKRASLKMSVPDEAPAVPTERLIRHIAEIEATARLHIDYTTIEGRLEEVSVHGTNHVNMWETLTNYRIECRVTPDLLEQAKTVLGRRVALTGRARYKNNKPTMMNVESMRVLRDETELPQPGDLGSINITGGVDPAEFVRSLRDAE